MEDHVVQPEQASEMERTIRERGGGVRLVFLKGEGHEFRRRGNVKGRFRNRLCLEE